MNPDKGKQSKSAGNILTRFLRLFQKHEQQHRANERRASDHRQRGAADRKKRRRQIAQATRRAQRRAAKGQVEARMALVFCAIVIIVLILLFVFAGPEMGAALNP